MAPVLSPSKRVARGSCWIAIVLVSLTVTPVAAQQGSLQVSAAAQGTTGDAQRGAGQPRLEPDFGVTWLQPGTKFGTAQLEVRGTRRQNELHFGRVYGSLRDLKYGGLTWTIEGGDTYYTPSVSDYKFSNLYAPAVTFAGGAVGARSERTEIGFIAGQATVWRNIFGSDPDALDQTIIAGRVLRHATDRLDVSARASRIRTDDLDEFTSTIAASDQASGGMRYAITPSLQVIADGGVVSYRRAGSTVRERDGSGLAGVHWLHSRGWLQVNVSRFSPGESPTINSPLPDRAGQFAAGEFDLLKRLRIFAGWEAFRSNLDPSAALAAGYYQLPRSSGTRQFAGVRTQIGVRSTLTLRAESGDRISKYVTGRQDIESDTGLWSADWHTTVRRMNGFIRFAQRSNVTSASRAGSYNQRDVSGQFFLRLSQSSQIFGLTTATTTTDAAGGGSTSWLAGGGAQLQVVRQGLWMRTEATLSRNTDLLTQAFIPRESISVGFNGYVTSRTSVGVDIYIDRAPIASSTGNAWATRSIVRLVQTIPTGSPYSPAPGLFRSVPTRAIGTVRGTVFTDWNGNGLQEPDEDPVRGVALRLDPVGTTETGNGGEFVFRNVPDGLHDVGLDLGTLPIDFDAPAIARLQVALSGNVTRQVAFGLIPLGAIRGRVVRDLNGNGAADMAEPIVDGAVVVLDGGQRSERSRRGQFAFEAVPSGEHTVTLLSESLPDGAMLSGEATRVAKLSRDRMTVELPFVVSIETRAEIRKTFPATTVGRRPASPTRESVVAVSGSEKPTAAPEPASAVVLDRTFALQVAAFDDPQRARGLIDTLKRKGLDAYLVEPPANNPNAPYRVRVGRYASRLDAERAAVEMARLAGAKLWVADGASRPPSGDR